MKFKDPNFIDEGDATTISLILWAKKYNISFKECYKILYPKLGKKAKEFIDKELNLVKPYKHKK